MSNVKDVQRVSEGLSRWTVAGPAGVPVHWTAEVSRVITERLIEWRATAGSVVRHGGSVRFDPFNGGTRITVRLRYFPPAGEFGHVVQAEANISRDREGKFDLTSWRFTAAGMPGGVMLQIGVHYTDVLEMLLGPLKSVSGMTAQLALPGENPDVAGLLMQHESGAISTLNAGYASASEYYLMNIYGREMTAYYSLHEGLKTLKRRTTGRCRCR